MYKFLSMVLIALLAGGGIFYALERHQNGKKVRDLSNEIAKIEGTIKETETASSRRAIQIENLKSTNKDLQKIIKDRDEKILAKSEITLKWKDSYFKIKNAKQSTVEENGNLREKVEFEHEEPIAKVTGFTLTNPPYAELKFEWTDDLKLELNLTRDKDGNYRVYADSNLEGLQVGEIDLLVDPTILDKSWYQKIGFGADIALGSTALRAWYDIMGNWYIGPVIHADQNLETSYGITLGWYPWR